MERCVSGYLSALVLLSCYVLLSRAECVSEETLCKEESSKIPSEQHFYRINDSVELDVACKHKLDYIQCIERYANECLSAQEQKHFKLLTKGSWPFLALFCNETSGVRKKYLENAGCYGRISPLLDVCAEEYEDSQNDVDHDKNLSPKDLLKKTCCIYFENIRCSSNVTASHCGAKAAQLLTSLLEERGGTYLNSRCKSQDKAYCSPPSSTASRINIEKNMFHGLVLSNMFFVIIIQCYTVMLGLDTN